ncbi:MAG: type I restriction-modification system endonuclease [Microcoleaceae cyanobacterium]
MQASQNFAFLQKHDSQLVLLATLAERYFKEDPNTCLIKLRQFGELLAQLVAAKVGLFTEKNEQKTQIELLNELSLNNIIAGQVKPLFHELRIAGNEANHQLRNDHRTALTNLKYARELGIWFHRTFSNDPNFKAGAFIPPSNPLEENETLKQQIEKLQKEAEEILTAAEFAQAKAEQEAELRQTAEELLKLEEADAKQLKQRLAELQQQNVSQPGQQMQRAIASARRAEAKVNLNEAETRRLIDAQLRQAGWEVDSESLTYAQGVRPQKNRNLAIAEWPTQGGRADYVLFVGLEVVGIVEAKRRIKDVSGYLEQAKRNSREYQIKDNEILPGGSWGEYKVPFVFATNGRDFLEQLRTQSGIWFCDVRRPDNLSRPLMGWYKPEALKELLSQDWETSQATLSQESFNYNIELRDYQIKAIQKIEKELLKNRRNLLLAMATGTGKTKTSIVLVYRLLKSKLFRRVLFLVDRTALGEQSANTFKETRIENLQTFADIFQISEPGNNKIDTSVKVNISTVQSYVKRLFYPSDNTIIPTVDEYDCIIVDECHRGYLLDRELSDDELTYRDEYDYISKYRRVLDYFDAVKIGLTATPALHTTQIFGEPAFIYSYREAVIDGWLIDHEPPTIIGTQLAETGMFWQRGENMEYFNPQTGELDLVHAPDEVKIEVEQFNKRVITRSFNQVVCQELAKHIDPSLPEKTLIFCATDRHADMVVDELKTALQKQYGTVDDDDVKKITGNTDRPLELIRYYKNEPSPKIAVTVDLLTTGIDVPAICNLVFLRRVNSRILYEQMLGRATRLCDEIKKTVFRIFDAVRLYEGIAPVSSMKPVAVNPNISFTQLVDDISTMSESSALPNIVEELLAKLQRKRKYLSDSSREQIESLAGMSIPEMVNYLKDSKPGDISQWLGDKKAIAEILDRRDGGTKPLLISHHQDQVIKVERGYGKGQKPQNYLDSFQAFLQDNLNKVPALMVIVQRPRELTRAQLKEVKLWLDREGYSEPSLQVAWQETTNEDIAASIIGFIRQAALGDVLVPYEERVDKAMGKILSSRSWSQPQRKWLERIGKQIKLEIVVDREAFDQGMFKAQGGFERINKTFDGQLESILDEINQGIWDNVG